jgi:DNA transformation protein
MDESVSGATNIGPTIASRLEAVGISTMAQLRQIGPAKAYGMIRADNPGRTIPVCYYLYSLQGALEGVHWDDLSDATKQRLVSAVATPQQPGKRSRPPTRRKDAG